MHTALHNGDVRHLNSLLHNTPVCEWVRVKHVGPINQWCASCMFKHTNEVCQHCILESLITVACLGVVIALLSCVGFLTIRFSLARCLIAVPESSTNIELIEQYRTNCYVDV